jgi:ribosome biogenesis GTPase
LRAQIIRSAKRVFDCQRQQTQDIVQAVTHASVLKDHGHLAVGDHVILEKQDNSEEFVITKLIDRESEIFRRNVREKKKKVVASNVDVLMIVSSVSTPLYKPGLIDRYLIRAVQWDIPAVVILNKMDEFEKQFDIDFEKFKFNQLGLLCYCVSATNKDDPELKELKKKLEGMTAILLGQSGVGKSRLITNLSDGKVQLESRELAKGVNKGSHTTTWSELVDCGSFKLIDSPGVRSMALSDISLDEIDELFPDLYEGFSSCKFPDCKHQEKSTGCYFQSLDPEVREHQVLLERLESYKKIREEIMQIPEWER